MKKMVVILGAVMLAGLTGCATQEYVRTQVDPVADRLGKLEAKVSQLNGMVEANKAAIAQANDKAQQALEAANKVAGEVKKTDSDAMKAEDAAMRAEKAAKDAEQAANEARQLANKSEKIFKLEQKK
jgi:outer membrane murein-binding lipoprotein Lpp